MWGFLLSAMVSFLGVGWLYYKELKLAKDKLLVDNPDARKLQRIPVPVRGGIAVFFGVACGVLVADGFFNGVENLLPVFCAMLVMMYVGGLDDMLSLSPRVRLVIQILVILGMIWSTRGCVDSFHGLFGIQEYSWWIGVPLTVFAGVGIINAINMIDGVNGLSSGLCMVYNMSFGYAFMMHGDVANAVLAFCMVGALLVFWLHNVFGASSKMFIGDAGTMMMGVLMTWFVIQLLRQDSILMTGYNTSLCLIAMSLATLVVPVFDAVRVMLNRMRKGLNPFHPDKTHIHHIFIIFGLSHSLTMITIILMDVLTMLVWLVSYKMGASQEQQFIVVMIVGLVLVWGSHIGLRHIKHAYKPLMERMRSISLSGDPEKKHWWGAIRTWLDSHEIQDFSEKEKLETRLDRKFNYRKDD